MSVCMEEASRGASVMASMPALTVSTATKLSQESGARSGRVAEPSDQGFQATVVWEPVLVLVMRRWLASSWMVTGAVAPGKTRSVRLVILRGLAGVILRLKSSVLSR